MMKVSGLAFVVGASAASVKEQANPLGKVLELMGELTAKVNAEGEAEAAAFKEYFEWCDDVNKNTQFEIKSAKSRKEKLEAKISELSGNIQADSSKIDDLASEISANTKDVEAATAIRSKEEKEFTAAEKELAEGVDTLVVLSAFLQKNPQKTQLHWRR